VSWYFKTVITVLGWETMRKIQFLPGSFKSNYFWFSQNFTCVKWTRLSIFMRHNWKWKSNHRGSRYSQDHPYSAQNRMFWLWARPYWGRQGGTMPWALNHWGRRKVPTMSLSSIQYICSRKILGSNQRWPESLFWLLFLFLKSGFSSCSGAHWKFTLRLLFTLWRLESSVYCASWGKSTTGTILPLSNMD